MPEGCVTYRQLDYLLSLFEGNEKDYKLTKIRSQGKRISISKDWTVKATENQLKFICCRGKYYFFFLQNDMGILAHHGMAGHWSAENESNAHVKMTFRNHENRKVTLYWVNERFGEFSIYNHEETLKFYNGLAKDFIGHDPLSEEEWMETISKFGSRKKIRATFFDQRELCSGIGNYLIAEIFYKARLHPEARFSKLSKEELVQLFHISREMLQGHYERKLEKVIYKKEKDPEGRSIKSETIGSRTMHWVPEVQTKGV